MSNKEIATNKLNLEQENQVLQELIENFSQNSDLAGMAEGTFKDRENLGYRTLSFALDDFTEAMNFAYDYLDKLNDKPDTESGQYRIIGVYEILYTHDNSVPSELN